jgi:hypothetical protein
MADYYSILKKTIASLPENNGAARRSVYSRARNAIVNQLKAYEPPLAPSEITAEQLRLEEAIRKVEAEAARESLGLGPVAPKVEPAAPAAPASVAAPKVEAAAPKPDAPAEPVAAPAGVSAGATIPSPLKDTLEEAQTLGSAASQAVQHAKEAVDPRAEPAPAAPARQEPAFESHPQTDESLFEPADEPQTAAGSHHEDDSEQPADLPPAKKSRAKRNKPAASDALRDEGSIGRLVPIAAAAVVLLGIIGGGAYFLLMPGDDVAVTRPAVETPDTQTAATEQPVTEIPDASSSDEGAKNTDRLLNDGDTDVVAPDARTVTTTTITPPADTPSPSEPAIVSGVDSSQPSPQDAPDVSAEEPVAVPEDNLSAISPDETAPSQPVAAADTGVQRSILYEEGEETGGAGTAAQGAVTWSLEEETNLDGKSQAVLSALVEVPERDVKVDIRIKPNDDTSLPASHLVEIKYEFPEDFAPGDVVNVPGLVMKPTEEARGDALIGASVKVSPGIFWIALSSLPNEQQRNLALLRERGWIDIPMLYENGKRGILTLEKGSAGADAVEKAISAWQAG